MLRQKDGQRSLFIFLFPGKGSVFPLNIFESETYLVRNSLCKVESQIAYSRLFIHNRCTDCKSKEIFQKFPIKKYPYAI